MSIAHFRWVTLFGLLYVAYGGKHQKALLRELFETRKYNIMERPVYFDNDTLTVELGFSLQQIILLDEKNQFLQSSMWIDHTWNDSGLTWDPEKYGNITRIRLSPYNVWRPDIFLYNTASEEFDTKAAVNVVVNYDGTVVYIPPAMLKSVCQVNIRWFPFDEQFCKLKFGSWTYDEAQVNITAKDPPVSMDNYVENGEWLVVSAIIRRNSVKYDCCDEVYPDITFYFQLQRLALYYYFNLVIPSALISIMALLVFTLPVDSGEKMGLSVTILLSLTVFMMVVSEKMPRTSEALPLLGLYFACIMFICSIALLASVWVLNLHHFPYVNDEPPKWVRYGICVYLAKLLLMNIPPDLAKQEAFENTQKRVLKTMKPEMLSMRNSRSLINNVLDTDDDEVLIAADHINIALALPRTRTFNGTNGCNLSQRCKDKRITSNGLGSSACDSSETAKTPRSKRFEFANGLKKSGTVDGSVNHVSTGCAELKQPIAHQSSCTCSNCMASQWTVLRSQLFSVIKELKVVSEKINEDSKAEKFRNLWRFAARVVDRFCLVIFSSVNLICTCLMLFSAPGFTSGKTRPPEFPKP